MNLQKQLFIGDIAPSKENFRLVENTLIISKPKHQTALWTSTYHPIYGSAWVQFCFESLSLNVNELNSYLITPAADARIYEINIEEDLQYLVPKYINTDCLDSDFPQFMKNSFAILDYEKMKNDYDGIHLTELGQIATRFTIPSLYGWDVECTLWLNPAWEKVESLGPIEYKPEREMDF